MFSLSMKFGKACVMLLVATSLSACVDMSLYEKQDGDEIEQKIPNSFDFSTVQKVKLSVDYSAREGVSFQDLYLPFS